MEKRKEFSPKKEEEYVSRKKYVREIDAVRISTTLRLKFKLQLTTLSVNSDL